MTARLADGSDDPELVRLRIAFEAAKGSRQRERTAAKLTEWLKDNPPPGGRPAPISLDFRPDIPHKAKHYAPDDAVAVYHYRTRRRLPRFDRAVLIALIAVIPPIAGVVAAWIGAR